MSNDNTSTDADDPSELPRSEFRSDAVYRCPYCHTKTNLFEPLGFPAGNPRVRCPITRDVPKQGVGFSHVDTPPGDEKHAKHVRLQQLIDRREELDERLDTYAGADDAEELFERLEAERDVVEREIAELREWFTGYDDVEDADQTGSVNSITDNYARIDPQHRESYRAAKNE